MPEREFTDVALPEFVAFLQGAVDAQLPEADRFTIRSLPQDAGETVSISAQGQSLHELLKDMGFPGLDVSKIPPDLLIEPYYRRLAGIPADGQLTTIYSTAQGLPEETRELIRDQAGWEKMRVA